MDSTGKWTCNRHACYLAGCPDCRKAERDHQRKLDTIWSRSEDGSRYAEYVRRVKIAKNEMPRRPVGPDVSGKDDPRPRNLDAWAENMVECARIRRELAEQTRAGISQTEPDAEAENSK